MIFILFSNNTTKSGKCIGIDAFTEYFLTVIFIGILPCNVVVEAFTNLKKLVKTKSRAWL
jgi:hypothetical protein